MVEFKTQYGRMEVDPNTVSDVEVDGNLTIIRLCSWNITGRVVVSDSYSEAMRKLGRNV